MEPKPLKEAADSGRAEIISSAEAMGLTVTCAQRTLRAVTVSELELDSVASLSNSINLTFFGICVGALVAFGIVLLTVSITDPKLYALFGALTFASTVAALYFGVRGALDYLAAQRRLRDIKAGLS